MTEHTLKHICAGIVAHVDSGKTTLSEAMLYLTGATRKLGRVDHQDAFLDTFEMEKARGITIFSKQAEFTLGRKGRYPSGYAGTCGLFPGDGEDAPGSGLRGAGDQRAGRSEGAGACALEAAAAVSGAGVPFYQQDGSAGRGPEAVLAELRKELDSRCMDFGADLSAEEQQEELAVCEEALLERYLEGRPVENRDIRELIRNRKVFPCYFGSALKMEGVQEFLEGTGSFHRVSGIPVRIRGKGI